MLNLNNANVSEAPQMERTLIPAGTVCRAMVTERFQNLDLVNGLSFLTNRKPNGWS